MNLVELFTRALDDNLYCPIIIKDIDNKYRQIINNYLKDNDIEFVDSMYNNIIIRKDYLNGGYAVERATWYPENYLHFDTFEEVFEKIKKWLDFLIVE